MAKLDEHESFDDLFNQLNQAQIDSTIEILSQLNNKDLNKLIRAIKKEINNRSN